MAPTRRSILPGLAVCASLLAVCRVAFVASPQQVSSRSVSLRATDKEQDAYTLPKPNMEILNDAAQVGLTYDQDKRGNMWSVETAPVRKATEDDVPTPVFFIFLLILTFGGILYFAILTGTDPKFGGVIGDGSFAVGD
jgi:hypothetical protein